jgi:hypothetical protein
MPTKALNRILQGLLLGGLCQAVPVWASAPEQTTSVGQVNLVLGKATLVHANGARETVKSGLAVNVGDRVETQGNAHVHIRFVDNELVSVRPLSRLEIQRYEYHAEDPAASVVKFNLIEGVARAVSGNAAKAARQNFRLNTPVAAIGVRGTDFVVSADPREVRALVNEGAIVMAPFSSTCLVDAIGPCTDNSLELAGGSQQMALLAAGATEPVLVAVAGGTAAETFLASAAMRANGTSNNRSSRGSAESVSDKEDGNEHYSEAKSTDVAIDALAHGGPGGGDPSPGGPSEPPVPPIRDYTPDRALTAQELTATQELVWSWGHYDKAMPSRELLVASYGSGSMGLERGVTISSLDDNYWLFRTNPAKDMESGLGELSFDLNMAQAFYTPNGGVANSVNVLDGGLTVDFSQSQGSYSTWLDMNAAQLGSDGAYHRFESQGSIYDMFRGYFGGDDLRGVVTQDGKEAGYAFEGVLPNGTLEGLTLWGNTP